MNMKTSSIGIWIKNLWFWYASYISLATMKRRMEIWILFLSYLSVSSAKSFALGQKGNSRSISHHFIEFRSIGFPCIEFLKSKPSNFLSISTHLCSLAILDLWLLWPTKCLLSNCQFQIVYKQLLNFIQLLFNAPIPMQRW